MPTVATVPPEVKHTPFTRNPEPATCARCGEALLPLHGTVVPVLGVLGPKCERLVGDAFAHLQAASLGDLILTGEVKFTMVRSAAGTFAPPQGALDLIAAGRRAGIDVAGSYGHGTWTARLKDPRKLLNQLARRGA